MFCVCFTSALGAFMAVVWWSQSALSHVLSPSFFWKGSNLSNIFLLGQWLNFRLFGITYLVGKIKFKLFFFRVHWLSEFFNYRWNRWTFPDLLAIPSLRKLSFLTMPGPSQQVEGPSERQKQLLEYQSLLDPSKLKGNKVEGS